MEKKRQNKAEAKLRLPLFLRNTKVNSHRDYANITVFPYTMQMYSTDISSRRWTRTYKDFNLVLGALDNVARHALEHANLADNLLAQEVADLDIVAVHVNVDGEMGVHGLESVPVALHSRKKR